MILSKINTQILLLIILLIPTSVQCGKPINLNTATMAELLYLSGVNKKRAQSILDYRRKNNGFGDVEELRTIFTDKLVDQLLNSYIIYSVSRDEWESRIANDLNDMYPERLIVKTFGLNGNAAYLSFPDGGNMLIDTGSSKDSKKIIKYLKNEIVEEGNSKLMKLFGWKPRIDWLVITNLQSNRIGGLEKILEKFDVKEIITSLSMEDIEKNREFSKIMSSYLVADSIQTNLVDNETIDIKQTESLVKLIAIGTEYVDMGASLCLRLTYEDFSFLFLSDINSDVQEGFVEDYGSLLRSNVVLSSKLNRPLKNKINAKFSLASSIANTFVTDGTMIYQSEGTVEGEAPGYSKVKEKYIQRSEEEDVEKRYSYALGLFLRHEYSMTVVECKKILETDPDHKEARNLLDKSTHEIKKWEEYMKTQEK